MTEARPAYDSCEPHAVAPADVDNEGRGGQADRPGRHRDPGHGERGRAARELRLHRDVEHPAWIRIYVEMKIVPTFRRSR